MVVAADNDRAWKARVGRNRVSSMASRRPRQTGSADGAFFSEEELEAGFSDWNDSHHDEVRRAWSLKTSKHSRRLLHYRTSASLLSQGTGEDHDNDQNISSGVNITGDHDEEETQAAWCCHPGTRKNRRLFTNRQDPRSQWDFGSEKWRVRHFRVGWPWRSVNRNKIRSLTSIIIAWS